MSRELHFQNLSKPTVPKRCTAVVQIMGVYKDAMMPLVTCSMPASGTTCGLAIAHQARSGSCMHV